MSGKLSRKSKRGSKSLTLRDDDADDMMALNTAELSFGSATAYEIPLESPRRSMLVPSHTLYPPSAYTKQSEGVEMHSSKELAAEDESSFEPLEAADATSTPLFGIGSSRAVPIPVQQEAKSSVEMEFEKERALLTSKNPVGGVLWRMRSESAWSAEFSMMDENKVRRWALKCPLSLSLAVRDKSFFFRLQVPYLPCFLEASTDILSSSLALKSLLMLGFAFG